MFPQSLNPDQTRLSVRVTHFGRIASELVAALKAFPIVCTAIQCLRQRIVDGRDESEDCQSDQ